MGYVLAILIVLAVVFDAWRRHQRRPRLYACDYCGLAYCPGGEQCWSKRAEAARDADPLGVWREACQEIDNERGVS